MKNEMYDDGFGLIPIEDEGFIPERDCPRPNVINSRPLQDIIINHRTGVKDNIEDHLNVIDNMTSRIFRFIQNDENITNLQISACKSKCTFILSGIEVNFALTGFWQYSIDNEPLNKTKIYAHDILNAIYINLFQKSLVENYPNYSIRESESFNQSILFKIFDPSVRFENHRNYYNVSIRPKDRRVFVTGKGMDDNSFEKSFMIDDFLKNLPETYLGIKKIEK